MNKKLAIFLLGITFLMALAVFAQAADMQVRVKVDNVKVRLKPDSSSPVIAQVPLGTVLKVESAIGEWYLVNLPADETGFVVSGYIHQSGVEVVGSTPPPVQKEKQYPPRQAYAPLQKTGPQIGVGLRLGYSSLSDTHYGGGLAYGLYFHFQVMKYLGIELSGVRFTGSVTADPEALSEGELSPIPIQLSIQGRFPVGDKIVPYVTGGAGYYLNSFSVADEIVDNWDAVGFDIEEKANNTIGFHFGGGLDFFFTDNLAVNADFRYCISKGKGSYTLTDQVSGVEASGDIEDLNFNAIMFGVGVKYCF